ncbi:MAG: hypothetical protein HUU37_03915 [Bdellovibrionales bacterium]|nr:hypothetical protein [Bdellovibrionales bacterium]
MKKFFTLLFITLAVSAPAFAEKISFNCVSVKDHDHDDDVRLSITDGKRWHLVETNGGYWGNKEDGVETGRTGRYLLFKAPESTISRGDAPDDIRIQSDMFDGIPGSLLIVWVDEEGVYHTDKYLCVR